jgi:hypothetical protein
VENLALQIAELDLVIVGQYDVPHPRRSQVAGGRGTQAGGPNHQDSSRQQSLVTFDSELIQQYVPGISEQLLIVHHGVLISPPGVRR